MPPPTRMQHGADSGGAQVVDIDQAALRRLAEAATAEEFCTLWLDVQSRIIGGVTGGVVVLEGAGAESPFVPVAVRPKQKRERAGLVAAIERVLKERKGIVMRSDSVAEPGTEEDLSQLVAFPILIGRKLHGAAALEMVRRPQDRILLATRQLQWGIAWLQNWVLRQAAWPEAHLKHRLTTSLEMAALVLEEMKFKSAATSFLTEMATRFDCDRVSLGFVRRNHVKVVALSHSAEFKKQMNLVRAIGQAMSESIDQQSALLYPEPEEGDGHVLRFHEDLARAHGDRAICTVPFVNHEGEFIGAIILERSQPRPFDRGELNVCDSVAAIAGPILDEKRLNDRLLIKVAWDSFASVAKKLLGPRHVLLKISALALTALILFFSFAQGQFRVTAKTALEGEIRRVVAAPYRGFIYEASVRAGDIVEKGQVLCRLDDRDLRLEHTRVSSERQQYILEHRKAMAETELAGMKVLTKKIHQAEAQIALLDEQIARAQLTAPFRGVVVSGDLSQSLGAPVETGQVLFEIAPLDAYRLILEVGEWDIRHLQPGQKGHLILTALPNDRFAFTVKKVTPVSLTEEGKSFFRVEARLDEASERLRPGMEGFGKVEIDRRRLIWIWTHDLIDWLRLKAWSWWP